MHILILGGDGYLGWPTAMSLAFQGHEITIADNYLRREICLETDSDPLNIMPKLDKRTKRFRSVFGKDIDFRVCDLTDFRAMEELFSSTSYDAVVHYAEQPSAPYSMMDLEQASLTLHNNLGVTFNLVWCVLRNCPECHIVKLGTMGEYGTPDIDIEEGFLDVVHNGRTQRFLYPREAGSLYHTTKILDTDLLWFYVRQYGLKVTDLMQGPVYGLHTPETEADSELATCFNYDDIFGTAVNRFLVQAVAGVPLTVYGKGGQTRGYLNIRDTLACVRLAVETPPKSGELRILNQFTETFSVNELAERVRIAGQELDLNVTVQTVPNPRKEMEQHYYNPKHSGLLDLGLFPNYMTSEILVEMLRYIQANKERIDMGKILPRVRWK